MELGLELPRTRGRTSGSAIGQRIQLNVGLAGRAWGRFCRAAGELDLGWNWTGTGVGWKGLGKGTYGR